MSTLHILWDESHIWGLLALRAAKFMGIPHRLVLAKDVAKILQTSPPAMLMVPGGNARHKAEALGNEGKEAIRTYVANGGQYLGFCGGAGLALSWEGGLELCPWQRAGFDDRMQHFMSGHLVMNLPANNDATASSLFPANMPQTPSLPVWWPGRFDAEPTPGMTVLATYQEPAHDFWLADLPIASLPPETFSTWQDLYGFSITPTFLQGQPCVVHGTFGKGTYTLSYSHLETPNSPHANQWLGHLLQTLAGIPPTSPAVPEWNLWEQPAAWEDKHLATLAQYIQQVLTTGLQHGLLFHRNPWLLGWRTGIAGSSLNNLWALIKAIQGTPPTPQATAFWAKHQTSILSTAKLFYSGCVQYLLAERLAITLAKSLPEALPTSLLKKQRAALFGPPMHAGGLYKDLILPLDSLAFLQLNPQY